MTSVRGISDAISAEFDFALETETLGSVRCKAITVAVMMDNVWEQARRKEIDGPTFVRRLLNLIGQRMEGEHKKHDKSELEMPLSESDVRRLTDKEIESFARGISAHNTWLFESRESAERPAKTNEKGEQIAAAEQRKITFPRNEGERDSDYLLRAVRRHMTEQTRRRQRLFQPAVTIGSQVARLGAASPVADLGSIAPHTNLLGETVVAIKANRDMIDRIMAPAGMPRDPQKSLWGELVTKHLTTSLLGATGAFNAARTPLARRFPDPLSAVRADYERLAESIHTPLARRFPELVSAVRADHERLVESLRTSLDVTRLPRVVSDAENTGQDLPEIRLAGEVEIEGGSMGCIALLEAFDPDLVRLYKGAHDALQGTNADRERHCLSSLRELYNHLMRNIAPDQMVLEWVGGDDDKTLVDKGKPTRKARIRYVLRDLDNGPLADFTASDTKAFVDLWNVLNHVHSLRPAFSERELLALWLQANLRLRYILGLVQLN